MSGLLITREVHTQLRAIIDKNRGQTNAAIARETGFSDKTIRRVRRGGKSYVGYKRQLSHDHLHITTDPDMPPAEHMTVGEPIARPHKVTFIERFKARFA